VELMERIEGIVSMPEFIKLMAKCNPEVIVEIGCEDARDSKLFHSTFSDARIIAIEGLPSNYEAFLQKLPFEAYQMVITSYDGEVTYFQKSTPGIHGIYDRGPNYSGTSLVLPCQKFSTFCKEHNILKVDAVKIDVEGATLEVLQGFEEILPTVKILHIETEDSQFFIGQHLQSEVHEFLYANGFTPLIIGGSMIEPERTQFDEVWVRNDISSTYI
jgi:FkbM family methyltransferase